MEIIVENPVRARVLASDQETELLRKYLSFTDKSVAYQISRHYDNRWWRDKNHTTWEEHLLKLKSELHKCILWQEEEQNYIRPGSIPYLNKFDPKVTNQVVYPEFKKIPWKKSLEFTPYHYQQLSVDTFLKQKHGHVTLATGLGKSLILLMIAREIGDCLIVTPSKSIFLELLNLFNTHLGKNKVGAYGNGKKDITKPITIAIGKSLTTIKKDSKEAEFFSKKAGLLVDESHSWSADTLEQVCHGVASLIPYRFFASATQVNNSGKETLLHSIIGKEMIEMNVGDGIAGGFLCPLKFNVINTYSKDTRQIKDPMKCKRTHFLYNENIAKISAKIANASFRVKKQSTLILVEELVQIQMIKKYLEVPFGYVHAGSAKEAEKFGLEKVDAKIEVERFNNGETKVLIGTKAISTGTNIFPTHNTINCQGGGSEIVTKQGVMGRSTRKLELSKFKDLHEPKLYSTIFDFDVKGVPMLKKQLEKRIAWYEETGETVNFCNV